ncbi:MAG: CHASE4 domain-containing protein [Christensenellaceae bacterium]
MANSRKRLSLRFTVILIVCLVFAAFCIVFFTVFTTSMSAMLLNTETRYLEEEREYVLGAIERVKGTTRVMARDVAFWDETVRFVEGKNPDFISNNWPGSGILEGYKCDLLIIKNRQGEDHYAEFYSVASEKYMEMPSRLSDSLSGLAQEVLDSYQPSQNTSFMEDEISKDGIYFFNSVPYYISIMPVTAFAPGEEAVGTVITGIVLSNQYLKMETRLNQTDFYLTPSAEEPNAEYVINRQGDETVSSSILLTDIDGNSISLTMLEGRTTYQYGRSVLIASSIGIFAVIAGFMLILYFAVIKVLLRPVEDLNKGIGRIGEEKRLDTKRFEGTREFFALSSSINGMLGRLEESNISLETVGNILDAIDAYVYVTDPGTDQLVFMNNSMKKHYGFDDSVIGKTCWKVLQSNMEKRCSFCPVKRLEDTEDTAVSWELYSTVTERYYRNTSRLIEWKNKKKAHLQQSIDITDEKKAAERLKQRLKQQELMSEISRNFLSAEETGVLINKALSLAGVFIDASRLIIGIYDKEAQETEFSYQWLNPGQKNVTDLLGQRVPFHEGLELYEKYINEKVEYVACNDVEHDEAYSFLSMHGVKSFIYIPLTVSGEFWGTLGVHECARPRAWDESDIHLFTLIGSVISGVIQRSRTEDALTRMSSIVESSPAFVSYITLDGKYEYVNPGAMAATGYTEEEMMGQGIDILFDKETVDMVY